jgi:hypothetical protein
MKYASANTAHNKFVAAAKHERDSACKLKQKLEKG